MSEIIVALIVGGLSLAGTLGGSYLAHRKSAARIAYRLDSEEGWPPNNLIERTYCLERRCDVTDEKIKVVNHRIDDLEKEG